MITAKSCLAIRSGRFNERNAMLKKYFMLLTACLFFTAAWLLFAAEAGALSFSQSTGLVSLKVTPEYKTLSPASETIDIIAEADIKPGWHLYWDNPGDIGGPTSLSFFESPHYTEIGSTHTAPEKSVYEDIITSYVYTKKVYFRSTFALKNLEAVQRLPFNLVLSYTACSESCLPEEIALSFALPVAETAEKNPTFLNTLLTAENTFPVRLSATASLSGELLKLELQDQILKDCSEAEFVSRHPKKALSRNCRKPPSPNITVCMSNSKKKSFRRISKAFCSAPDTLTILIRIMLPPPHLRKLLPPLAVQSLIWPRHLPLLFPLPFRTIPETRPPGTRLPAVFPAACFTISSPHSSPV